MTTEKLKDLLTGIADEATPTPLHKRAVSQSRRMTRHRAVLAAITALAVTGTGIFGLSALADRPNREDGAADKALPTSDVGKLEGTFYLSTSGESQTGEMWSWRTVDDEPFGLIPDGTDDGLYTRTATVSPNGESIAYMTMPGEEGTGGNVDKIKVREVAGGDIEEVAEYSGFGDTCSTPAWTPDGRRLLVDRGAKFDERTGFVDVATGEFTAVAAKSPCDLQSDTKDRVYATSETGDGRVEVFVTGPDGESRPTGAADVADAKGRYIRELVAVSPDGRFLCVNVNTEPGDYGTDLESQFNYCDMIIDTATGEEIELKGIGEADLVMASPSVFAISGRLVTAVGSAEGPLTQRLYDYEGDLIDEIEVPLSGGTEPANGFVPGLG